MVKYCSEYGKWGGYFFGFQNRGFTSLRCHKSERSWRLPSEEEITVRAHTHQKWPNTQTLKHHWGELYAFAYLPTIISFQVYKEFMGVIAISSLTACVFHLSLPCAAEIDWFGIIYPGRSKVHPSSHSESPQGLLVEHIRGPQVIFT